LVKLRLQRTGTKNDPHYKIVVANATSPRDGRYIESIGHYHPTGAMANQLHLHADKALQWLRKGAQPTDTVKALLKKQGILDQVKQ